MLNFIRLSTLVCELACPNDESKFVYFPYQLSHFQKMFSKDTLIYFQKLIFLESLTIIFIIKTDYNIDTQIQFGRST